MFCGNTLVFCLTGVMECPAYPTELVIALDMSDDVTSEVFEGMRSTVINLLEDISIAESNCPRGARVALVSYSSGVKYLFRFSDYHRKKHLIEAVNNIALERTASRRNIGAAMRFVARHVFKRTRKGLLMRKVAVFITNGPSQDTKAINTAVLEFKAHDIHPAVIAYKNVPNVLNAFAVSTNLLTGRLLTSIYCAMETPIFTEPVVISVSHGSSSPNILSILKNEQFLSFNLVSLCTCTCKG